jgi:DNA-binding MarR family transcriptional regulator
MAGRKKPVPQPVTALTYSAKLRAITEEFLDVTDEEISEIRKFIYRAGRPMTNQEIADRLGMSKGHVSRQVSRFVAAGFLTRKKIGRRVAIY